MVRRLSMSELIAFTQISPPVRMRNDQWQRRFSEHFALIEKLREFVVEPDGVEGLVAEVCEAFEVSDAWACFQPSPEGSQWPV